MAFLTAAELVIVSEDKLNKNQDSVFKILLISDSDSFSISKEVKEHFVKAGVEVNALDLSDRGNLGLQALVTSPLSEHYVHETNNEGTVDDVCSRLLKGNRLWNILA